ncbi:NTP transferase domain-containing protein [Enterobacteriaceae bacterium H16N7]|nr:NTP transferase domain-containing protein [Dryocola clanedunensis]
MKPGILIAAAGLGERFRHAGGVDHKLNASLADGSVFEQTLRNACASNLAVHVVTRPDNLQVQQNCIAQRIPFTLLESAGLGESIATGVAATSDWHGWLVHLADMPFVPPDVFVQIACALEQHSLVRPRVSGLPGHPVGFSSIWAEKLCQLKGDNGARDLLRDQAIHFIELEDSDFLRDIDLPSQLTALSE